MKKATAKKAAAKKAAAKKAAAKKATTKKATAKKAAAKKATAEKATAKKTTAVRMACIVAESRWTRKFPTSKWSERIVPIAVLLPAAEKIVAVGRLSPQQIAEKVMTTIDLANAGKVSKRELASRLGAAWTYAVVTGLGWERIELKDRAGREFSDIVTDPERRWVIDTHDLMRRLLGLDSTWCGDNTALLLYNMIAARSLPMAKPGGYLPLG